jgi:hypothetical protein
MYSSNHQIYATAGHPWHFLYLAILLYGCMFVNIVQRKLAKCVVHWWQHGGGETNKTLAIRIIKHNNFNGPQKILFRKILALNECFLLKKKKALHSN